MKIFMMTIAGSVLVWVTIASAAKINIPVSQCKAWFAKVDRNKDGSIGPNENAAGFYDRITLGGASNDSDDSFIMSRSFFLAECSIGSLGEPPV